MIGLPVRSEPVEVQQLSTASNVTISGTPKMGNILEGKYSYTNPNSWEVVGTLGFSDNSSDFSALAIASDGTKYMAYSNSDFENKATVMKFDTETQSRVYV